MRHRHGYKKVGKNSPHRKAMFRNMATSLIDLGRIHTTTAKAKAIRPVVEKLVTTAVRGNKSAGGEGGNEKLIFAKRKVDSYLKSKDVTRKLFSDVAERFKERPGGYLRIIKTGFRKGDKAEMALVEFVDHDFTAAADNADQPEKTKKSEEK